MTIKKQFFILSSIIIAIPLFIISIVCFQKYLNKPERILINGTEKIKKFKTRDISKKDKKALMEILRILPPEVESCIFIEPSGKIIFTNFSDSKITTNSSKEKILDLIDNSSDNYFYQFTKVKLSEEEATMIARIPTKHKNKNNPYNLITTVMSCLVFLVLICVIFIILISRTIFKSIIQIKDTTKQFADGNLSQSCLPSKSDIKKNEITSIQESLEKMRIALLEEQNRKQKFIMGMSHDLRTPIAIIKGYIEAINDGIVTSPEEINKSLELIHTKSTQLQEMINTLINLMKMDSYEILKDVKQESITQIIKDFAKNSFVMANVFKRKIITDINLPKDILIEVNKMLVQRAFENLFSNAIRYTKDNDSIFLNAYIVQEKSEIIFEIKDTGIGIKKNDLNYIFDIFYRGTNSRREDGMGIGLSVVKNVITTYGWKIDVSSEVNEGSTFTIHIPFVEN